MNIDVLDRVENRFNKLIRKSSELVVVQFQPFKAESINPICFRFFLFLESYLVRSSNVGVGIWEIRLLSSQRFWRWSPNSSKSPSANLIQHFKGINDTFLKKNHSRGDIVVIQMEGFELMEWSKGGCWEPADFIWLQRQRLQLLCNWTH